MSSAIGVSNSVRAYLAERGVREHPALRRCRLDTAKLPYAEMQIAPEQGAVMALLAKLTGAKRYLEIGTFTGYSALAVALALPASGRVVCLDVSEDYISIARRYWNAAGVAARIEARIGHALPSLDRMIALKEKPFDMAFIDADKKNYGGYYERSLGLVRKGGLILIDNALWYGRVADPAVTDDDTSAIRALNRKIHGDKRVDMALSTIGDGLMIALKC
ncbi:MAG: O-methyltransferase [Alphaproteobacteria bacterium]